MRPTLLLVRIALALMVLAFLATVWQPYLKIWIGSATVFGFLLLLDLLILLATRRPRAERITPGRFAVGVDQNVVLRVANPSMLTARFDVFDGIPPQAVSEALPWSGSIARRTATEISYPVRLLRRGRLKFTPAHILQASPLGLWTRPTHTAVSEAVRVYPNYEPVLKLSLLAVSHQENQMGIIRKNRLGLSREFHQLRDYQEGDVLSQIDWKATSRRLSLISREYDEQRDQNVVLAVDCGRRMRAIDGELTQFDHCINAMVLTSYLALRQTDHVGIFGFGGGNRWLPPVKGPTGMTRILNHLYDYESKPTPTDFDEAGEQLMQLQRRRSLIIFLTNVRSEDASDFLRPLALLRRRHVVLFASLKESEVLENLESPVHNLDSALSYAASFGYLEQRRRCFEELDSHKIITLDVPATDLPLAIANKYLEIKARGIL
jgi:uncharacterized protein (DUF58 family)